MNRGMKYQKSIADELIAIKDRVEYFIDHAHNGENGTYREIILFNFLRKIMPDGVNVGTGFVRNENEQLTKQIDIIIYKSSYPTLFKEGDFVILMPESILGVIEVKSKTETTNISQTDSMSAIEKAKFNGEVIGNKNIFNGIFGYETTINLQRDFRRDNIARQLEQSEGYLNHIAFNSGYFMRYWPTGNPILQNQNEHRACYSFYDLSLKNIFCDDTAQEEGLAFGYFISNLLETVYSHVIPSVLTRQYFEFLYPLENTKEEFRLSDRDIFIIQNDG